MTMIGKLDHQIQAWMRGIDPLGIRRSMPRWYDVCYLLLGDVFVCNQRYGRKWLICNIISYHITSHHITPRYSIAYSHREKKKKEVVGFLFYGLIRPLEFVMNDLRRREGLCVEGIMEDVPRRIEAR